MRIKSIALMAGITALAALSHAQVNTFIGGSGGFWNNPANWSLGLPGAGQTLSVGVPTTHSSGSYTSQTLNYTAGLWTQNGGSLSLTGAATNSISSWNFTGGTYTSSALTNVLMGATLSGGSFGANTTINVYGTSSIGMGGVALGNSSKLTFWNPVTLSGIANLGTAAEIKLESSGSLASSFTSNGGKFSILNGAMSISSGQTATINSQIQLSQDGSVNNSGLLQLGGGGQLAGSINGFTGNVTMTGGSYDLTFSGDLETDTLTINSGAQLNAFGNINIYSAVINGQLNLLEAGEESGASWANDDTVTVGNTGLVNIDTWVNTITFNNLTHRGQIIADGDFQVTGTSTWERGQISGSGNFSNVNTLNLTTAQTKTLGGGGALNAVNQGIWNHNAGILSLAGSATLNNAAAGTYNVNGTNLLVTGPGATLFNNEGTLNVTPMTATQFTMAAPFDNSGNVNINGNAFVTTSGVTNSGNIVGTSGSLLVLGGNSSIDSGTINVPNVVISGAAVFKDAANYNGIDDLTINSGGNLSLDTDTSLGSLDELTVNGTFNNESGISVNTNFLTVNTGGIYKSDLGNSNTNSFFWNGGSLEGDGIAIPSFMTSAGTFIASAAPKSIKHGAQVILNGPTTHSAGVITFSGSASKLRVNGTYEITGNGVDFNGPTIHEINNFGTFRKKPTSTDVTTVTTKFNNPSGGLVDVQAGTLELIGGGTGAGTFNVEPGANIDFNLGNYNFVSGATFTGQQVITNGEVTVGAGANWAGNTIINGGFLALQSGALFGSGSLAVNGGGQLRVQSGTHTQSGAFANYSPGPKTLNNGNFIIGNNSQFKFANTGIETNNSNIWLIGGSAAIENLSGNNALTGLSQNNGTFVLGSLLLSDAISLNIEDDLGNSGTLAVDSNGELNIGGSFMQFGGQLLVNGTFTAGGPITIEAGTVGGTGTIDGGVNNSGSLSPGSSPGTLNIIGSYTQTSIGTALMEIESASNFDRLIVSGAGALGGQLNVVINPSFNLTDGMMFDLMTFGGGYTGQFSEVNTVNGNGFLIDIDYTHPTILRGFARPVPEPATMAALGLGLAVLVRRRRRQS
ncbi:MAG TPA: PEP-CTERM sorting domain-containing protein [Fimbriimonadaceae bacterium]|nr:PEP-CTERM sorting domain-containing protein [Fimbriimonadaceae bacterium]HRJ33304.1 PEP-CTERM sorting domain-containing protein [Fimbriimonadaceae bacterium]